MDQVGGGWSGLPDVDSVERQGAHGPTYVEERSGYGSLLMTPEEAKGIAANIFSWGGTGIGLWNLCASSTTHYSIYVFLFCNIWKATLNVVCAANNFNYFGHGQWGQRPEQRERMRAWATAACDRASVMGPGRRTYHYLPIYKQDHHGRQRNYKFLESGRSPLGAFKGPTLYFNPGRRGARLVYPFRVADGRDGKPLVGTLRFRILDCTAADTWRFDINGSELLECHFEYDDDGGAMPQVWVMVSLHTCPPFAGDNELGLIWLGDGSDTAVVRQKVPYMEELIVNVDGSALELSSSLATE